MLNCPLTLTFSPTFRAKRLKKACDLLGTAVVKRLVGFALFLLGANREDIARFLSMPFGTFLSLLIRIETIGLSGFEDRRKSSPLEHLFCSLFWSTVFFPLKTHPTFLSFPKDIQGNLIPNCVKMTHMR